MPIIEVHMWEGRGTEQKRRLARELTETVVRVLQCDPASVRVLLNDYPPQNWAIGGTLVADAGEGGTPGAPPDA